MNEAVIWAKLVLVAGGYQMHGRLVASRYGSRLLYLLLVPVLSCQLACLCLQSSGRTLLAAPLCGNAFIPFGMANAWGEGSW